MMLLLQNQRLLLNEEKPRRKSVVGSWGIDKENKTIVKMTLPPSKQSSATKSTAPQPYHCNIVLQTNAVANTRQTVSAIIYLIYQKTGWHQKDTIQENK